VLSREQGAEQNRTAESVLTIDPRFSDLEWLREQFAALHSLAPSRLIIEDRGFETPCFIWTGSKVGKGYGIFFGTRQLVHRVAWSVYYGPIPPGVRIHHHCLQHDCCRPDHLADTTAITHAQEHGETMTGLIERALQRSPLHTYELLELGEQAGFTRDSITTALTRCIRYGGIMRVRKGLYEATA
jgi:hypothetical protein